MYPIWALIPSAWVRTSKPATVPVPADGLTRPQSIRIVVDFPAPLGPRKPKISPRATSRLMSLTATKSPKRFVRFLRLTAGESSRADICGPRCFLTENGNEDIFERRRLGADPTEHEALFRERRLDGASRPADVLRHHVDAVAEEAHRRRNSGLLQ